MQSSREETTTVHLVRHGHIVNREEVFHGRLPGFPLSDKGREQAQAAAEYLSDRPIVAIYSSPMLRTRQTATIIQEALDPQPAVHVEPLLHEIYSPYDGRPHEEMEALKWDFYSDVTEEYEQPADILERVRAFFRKMRQEHPGQQTVGVTHADPLAFVWMWASAQQLTVEGRYGLGAVGVTDSYPATASISTFTFQSEDANEVPRVTYHRPY
jgi:broad specificity phosphatase PhoE